VLQATVVVTHHPNVALDSDSSAGTDTGSDSSAGTDTGSDSSVGMDTDFDSSAGTDMVSVR
tara:strand:- start:28 stop:210 length:183 start_codon:yes stop_codon:yes gene_type:complete